MATTVDHLPALAPHAHAEAGRELQATLVELIDLSLLGKQFHWTLTGPQFMSLHLQLDELVDSWRELADAVAERGGCARLRGRRPGGRRQRHVRPRSRRGGLHARPRGRAPLDRASRRGRRADPEPARPRRGDRPRIAGRADRRRPGARAAALDGPFAALVARARAGSSRLPSEGGEHSARRRASGARARRAAEARDRDTRGGRARPRPAGRALRRGADAPVDGRRRRLQPGRGAAPPVGQGRTAGASSWLGSEQDEAVLAGDGHPRTPRAAGLHDAERVLRRTASSRPSRRATPTSAR